MTTVDTVQSIFDDAERMARQAVERLKQGDIRDAAEKAWCSILRATNAVVLAYTGTEPLRTPQTTMSLDSLAERDPRFNSLKNRYFSRQETLHGLCFYLGICEPREAIERRIRETPQYIQDAKALVENRPPA